MVSVAPLGFRLPLDDLLRMVYVMAEFPQPTNYSCGGHVAFNDLLHIQRFYHIDMHVWFWNLQHKRIQPIVSGSDYNPSVLSFSAEAHRA